MLRWCEYGSTRGRVEPMSVSPTAGGRSRARAPTSRRRGNATLVEFTLEPEGDGTRLRVPYPQAN